MSDWRVLERHERIGLGKAGDASALDLTVRMAWEDLDPGLDVQEVRRMALRQLKRIVDKWEEEDWMRHTRLSNPMPHREAEIELPIHTPERDHRPPRPKLEWHRPAELSTADLRAAHQLLEGLLLLGVHGRAVGTGDLVKARKIGARALYRILEPDSRAYHYLKPYIRDMKSRGRRLLDLTPEGRELASKIRSGAITV